MKLQVDEIHKEWSNDVQLSVIDRTVLQSTRDVLYFGPDSGRSGIFWQI